MIKRGAVEHYNETHAGKKIVQVLPKQEGIEKLIADQPATEKIQFRPIYIAYKMPFTDEWITATVTSPDIVANAILAIANLRPENELVGVEVIGVNKSETAWDLSILLVFPSDLD